MKSLLKQKRSLGSPKSSLAPPARAGVRSIPVGPDFGATLQRLESLDSAFSVMSKRILILGDILTIALVTFIGFATHGEAGLSFLPRMAAAFFPLVVAWFLLAPWFGLFQDEILHNARQLWRPALTALFAAPLAAVLRGLILNAPIIPIFAVVLGGTTAFGMVVWRGLYFLLKQNSSKKR